MIIKSRVGLSSIALGVIIILNTDGVVSKLNFVRRKMRQRERKREREGQREGNRERERERKMRERGRESLRQI